MWLTKLMKVSPYEIGFGRKSSNILHEDYAKFRIGMDGEEMEALEGKIYILKKLGESSLQSCAL